MRRSWRPSPGSRGRSPRSGRRDAALPARRRFESAVTEVGGVMGTFNFRAVTVDDRPETRSIEAADVSEVAMQAVDQGLYLLEASSNERTLRASSLRRSLDELSQPTRRDSPTISAPSRCRARNGGRTEPHLPSGNASAGAGSSWPLSPGEAWKVRQPISPVTPGAGQRNRSRWRSSQQIGRHLQRAAALRAKVRTALSIRPAGWRSSSRSSCSSVWWSRPGRSSEGAQSCRGRPVCW